MLNSKDIIRKLSGKDIKEIKNAFKAKDFISYPRLGSDSKILPSQWKSWQVLQRYSVAFIHGNEETGELRLSEFGKEIAKELT